MGFWDILIRLCNARDGDPTWRIQDSFPGIDTDLHRIEAHSMEDAELEMGEITPEECNARKANWDKRHGY